MGSQLKGMALHISEDGIYLGRKRFSFLDQYHSQQAKVLAANPDLTGLPGPTGWKEEPSYLLTSTGHTTHPHTLNKYM